MFLSPVHFPPPVHFPNYWSCQLFDSYDTDGSATIDSDELFLLFCEIEVKHRSKMSGNSSRNDGDSSQSNLEDRGWIRQLMGKLLKEEGITTETKIVFSGEEKSGDALDFAQFCRVVDQFEKETATWGLLNVPVANSLKSALQRVGEMRKLRMGGRRCGKTRRKMSMVAGGHELDFLQNQLNDVAVYQV
jgi:hypothetical protein